MLTPLTCLWCSCFGVINSLNGEPEPNVMVEAVGRGSGECDLLQEESKTEQDGTFRIRGLLVSRLMCSTNICRLLVTVADLLTDT